MPDQPDFSAVAIVGSLGRRVIQAALYVVDIVVFIMYAIRGSGGRRGLFNRATHQAAVAQIIFTGLDALPAITILGLAVGAAVTTQLIRVMQVVGNQNDLINVLTQVVALELAPLFSAIIVIGRSGSAVTVDLGNMSLHREVDGLALLGINVQDFFITPRLVGITVSQLILSVYFAVLAVVGGVCFSALLLSFSYFRLLVEIPLAFDPLSLIGFAVKNVVFGLIIGATACYHGLRVHTSSTEVPQETQRAIVNSMVLIFLLDGLMAVALP